MKNKDDKNNGYKNLKIHRPCPEALNKGHDEFESKGTKKSNYRKNNSFGEKVFAANKSYKYGENKPAELKKIHRFSLWFISLVSIGSYFISLLSIDAVLNIFTSDKEVIAISKEGFHLYALGFLMMGISIYASSLFTSLSNGKVSAIISFARTFLFLSLGIILIPMLWGRIGIWLAVPIAEFLGLLVSLYSLLTIKNNYF